MKKINRKQVFTFIWLILLILSLVYNIFLYNLNNKLIVKNNNLLTINSKLENTNNELLIYKNIYTNEEKLQEKEKLENSKNWYDINIEKYLTIDYPIFTQLEQDENINIIRQKLANWEIQSITINNINWTNFDFFEKITDNFYFYKLELSFENYSDENYYIFNSISNCYFSELEISFIWKLNWKQTLLKTFNKLKNIIDNISEKNNFIHKKWEPILSVLLIWLWLDFFENYNISENEIETINNFKAKNINFNFWKN